MVTILKLEKSNIKGEGKFLAQLVGLSGDDKPTTLNGGDILNGSAFIEIDTQDIYLYDEENKEWVTPSSEEVVDNEGE